MLGAELRAYVDGFVNMVAGFGSRVASSPTSDFNGGLPCEITFHIDGTLVMITYPIVDACWFMFACRLP